MSLVKIIHETLEKEKQYVSKEQNQFRIRPSVLGSPCLRKIFYSATGVPEDDPITPKQKKHALDGKKRMALGTAVDRMLKSIFINSGTYVKYYNPDGSTNIDFFTKEPDYEFPVTIPDLFIKKGKIDGIFIIDGKLWLGEFKSINQKGFDALNGAKPDHVIQGITYYYAFNQLLKEGAFAHIKELAGFTKAEGIRFLYVNKDNTELQEFAYNDADAFFQKIVEKIFTVRGHFDAGTLPPRTTDGCFCAHKSKCDKDLIK